MTTEQKNILLLGHSEYPPVDNLKEILRARGFNAQLIRVPYAEDFPEADIVDGVIILGAPTGVYMRDKLSWIETEIAWLENFLKTDQPCFGICFGVQLLAHIHGGEVFPGKVKREFGYYELQSTDQRDELFGDELAGMKVFQDHGDTYALPKTAVNLLKSDLYAQQAAKFSDNVYGVQFHPEADCTQLMRFQRRFNPSQAEVAELVNEGMQHNPDANAWLAGFLGRLFA